MTTVRITRCVVVWCGVLCCRVLCCGVLWCAVLYSAVLWCAVLCCGVVCCGVVWCGVVWCGVVWCGVVWCGVVCGGVVCARALFRFHLQLTCRMARRIHTPHTAGLEYQKRWILSLCDHISVTNSIKQIMNRLAFVFHADCCNNKNKKMYFHSYLSAAFSTAASTRAH